MGSGYCRPAVPLNDGPPTLRVDVANETRPMFGRSGTQGPGPRLGSESGKEIMALGPALCCPLNGVGLFALKPQVAASFGLSNQKPTCSVFLGNKLVAGSKPKIWSSQMVLIAMSTFPLLSAVRSDWYQAKPKLVK